jgi:hypothetical protein
MRIRCKLPRQSRSSGGGDWRDRYVNKLAILLVVSLILPNFSFAQTQTISPPETLEEVKAIGMRVLRLFPGALREAWQEALGIWQKMWSWFKTNILVKIQSFFRKEIERRKPIIEEEFKKEKEEIRKEIPRAGEPLWERFKELIKQ